MKKYTVFIEAGFRKKLMKSPFLARKFAGPLKKAWSLPELVLDSGFRQGFNSGVDRDRGYDGRLKMLYDGNPQNQDFCRAFARATRMTFMISFQCDTAVQIDGVLRMGRLDIFCFRAAYDLSGAGGIATVWEPQVKSTSTPSEIVFAK